MWLVITFCLDNRHLKDGSPLHAKKSKITYSIILYKICLANVYKHSIFVLFLGSFRQRNSYMSSEELKTISLLSVYLRRKLWYTFLGVSTRDHLLKNHQVRCDLKKKTWFLPSLDECSPLEVMIVTIGKITIFKAQNKNIPLSVNHFLNTLRFEITKENQSAIRNNNIESFHAKWQQLASIIK